MSAEDLVKGLHTPWTIKDRGNAWVRQGGGEAESMRAIMEC